VESAKDLDVRGVEAVLKRFRELGFRRRSRRQRRDDGLPGELPTSEQMKKIRHLFEDLGWHETERRQGFAKRQCNGHPWPQDRAEANQLIEALKAMVRRGYRERKPRAGKADPVASA